jgi:hypothetical protein
MAIKKNTKKAHKRLNRTGGVELVRANGEGTLVEAIAGLMDQITYSISAEEPMISRAKNVAPQDPQLIGSPGDTVRDNNETITNMASSMPLVTNLSDVRLSDDVRTDLEKDGSELYSPINVEMYNETMCGTGAISTGALPMLFQPDYDGNGKGSKKKRRLKNKKHDGIRAMFTDDLDRSIQLMIEQMRVTRQI